LAVLEHPWALNIALCYCSITKASLVIPEVEEMLKHEFVIKYIVFKIGFDLYKVIVLIKSFRVLWIQIIRHFVDKKELLFTTTSLVLLFELVKF
jgi:hypothetical protein